MALQSIEHLEEEHLHDAQSPLDVHTVAFQGERGSLGDEAVCRYFGTGGQGLVGTGQARRDSDLSSDRHKALSLRVHTTPVQSLRQVELVPYRTFADVFRAVVTGEVDNGLVPVENSQSGSINDVYDLLRQHDLYVTGEVSHQVNQCLLCLPGQQLSDIKRVISHPQDLAQSDVFLRELGVEIVATYDTAGSAKMLREENLAGVAAVASAGAADLYQLEILAQGIQTIKDNFTRFIALGREPAPRREGDAKTMLVMATAHQPGSLYNCLGFLATHHINLLKLESRPSRQRPWEYVFYLDLEGHREDPAVRSALADLAGHTTFCKVLGSFARSI